MRVVAIGTLPLFYRFMRIFRSLFKTYDGVMAGNTELFKRLSQELLMGGSMGSVAAKTIVDSDRTVHKSPIFAVGMAGGVFLVTALA